MIYLSVTLGVLLIILSYFAIKFGLIILGVQDSIEECLDIIDQKYSSISAILEKPLFYDSTEVRQVLEDLKSTRDSLHEVAFSLSKNFNPDEPEEK